MKMQSPPLLASRARIIGLAAATAIIMGILLAANNVTIANAQQQQTTTTTTKIEKVWETPAEFKTPESVIYAPNENMLFVSNIDGQPDGKDNQGFISKVSPLNGSIIMLNWVTGLNAPKGMTIINNNNTFLYVSDITDLVEIDVNSGKIINRYNAPGSTFLNDVASDNQGYVYVSDTVTNTIYRLDSKNLGDNSTNNNNNASLQAWLQTPELNGPNGLYVDNSNNKLIVASLGAFSNPAGSIKVVDLQNRTVRGLGNEGTAVPIGGLDGIEADSTGRYYYVTDNAGGKLYVVNSNGTGYETLDLQNQGTADLGVILDENLIIIPMMQDNKLEAYRIIR
jgi:sugar lactone lactonase YvrE